MEGLVSGDFSPSLQGLFQYRGICLSTFLWVNDFHRPGRGISPFDARPSIQYYANYQHVYLGHQKTVKVPSLYTKHGYGTISSGQDMP